ncbi:MAG: hypothetical protein ACJAV7_003130 [Flavobacteriales bacterium]|jgi:hypothetical protein
MRIALLFLVPLAIAFLGSIADVYRFILLLAVFSLGSLSLIMANLVL